MEDYADNLQYRYKLRVIAADVSRERMLILPQDIVDYGLEPDELDIAQAVRMSMSIPFFFEPVRLTHRETGEVSYIVDGGILSNYPLFLFDSPGVPEWPTFGYLLVEDPNYERHPIQHQIYGPLTLFAAMFSTMMDAHDKQYVRDADFVRTIPIPTLGVRATDFDLSPTRAKELYEAGRETAEAFFRTWDFEKYKAEYRVKQSAGRRAMLSGGDT
jgi:NTE family protein